MFITPEDYCCRIKKNTPGCSSYNTTNTDNALRIAIKHTLDRVQYGDKNK